MKDPSRLDHSSKLRSAIVAPKKPFLGKLAPSRCQPKQEINIHKIFIWLIFCPNALEWLHDPSAVVWTSRRGSGVREHAGAAHPSHSCLHPSVSRLGHPAT
jgi:hypothetical protein